MHEGCVLKPNLTPCDEKESHRYFEYQSDIETVEFKDADTKQDIYYVPPTPKDFMTDRAHQELGDFLKRPTLIATLDWVPAGVSDGDIDPWTLFLNSTPIKSKLNNYAFMRGNMHIKVVVNASPFYYGAMLVNYTPTPTYVHTIDDTNVTALIPQSQKPHIWIDLRNTTAGEMVVPLIWFRNYVRATVAAEVALLGRLRNITYVGLSSANGATVTGVTVQVYAWMEDVVLTGNTSILALQAKDEYVTNGIISKPATAAAHWASYLVNVPVIGPYAKATQIGASAISHIAGLFGWTNVPVIEDVKPVKPVFYHDLASADISEPTNKVTLDPKAELSVDPRIVCSCNGEDEMSISNIVQKESFLTSVIWATNDAPDTLLFFTHVSPMMHDMGAATSTVYQVGFTPMAYLAEMFNSWRGDIIFTFRVISSKYHRGRLRVHWDPSANGSTTTDLSTVTMTKILDVGESSEMEIRIPYIQYCMWLYNRKALDGNNWSTSTATGYDKSYDNGGLTVRVINNLSAPIDTASVTILVFVRGAENLEFANPRDVSTLYSPFTVQSLTEEVDDTVSTDDKSQPQDDRYLINWGEAVTSIRKLLHRSTLYESVPLSGLNAYTTTDYLIKFSILMPRFPACPGYDGRAPYNAKGVVVSGSDFAYHYCHFTPLSWLSMMYVARRGSIQWHFQVDDPSNIVSCLKLRRSVGSTISSGSGYIVGYNTTIISNSPGGISTLAKALRTNILAGNTALVVTDNRSSPSLSAELPQMTNARYSITKPLYTITGYSEDDTATDLYAFDILHKGKTGGEQYGTILNRYVNAGTDFSLVFFLCTPQLTYCATTGTTPA